MAKRKSGTRSMKKRKTSAAASKRRAAPRAGAKRGVGRAAHKRKASRASVRKPSSPKPPAIREGVITHTELASSDPVATRTWCEEVLGWKFGESMPTPAGPYHMWRFENATGGGIRANNPPEVPGSIPYCEVSDIRKAYSKALASGGTEMLGPQELPGGMGWIAIVAAPGGVAIGFWSMK